MILLQTTFQILANLDRTHKNAREKSLIVDDNQKLLNLEGSVETKKLFF